MRWPEAADVQRAARTWSARQAERHPEIVRLGYFGSYARGDAGVGSDLDLIAIVERAEQPFERRAREWNLEELPVPAEILVYTRGEWDALVGRGGRFADTLRRDSVWVYP